MSSAQGNDGITSHSPYTTNVRDQNRKRKKKLFVASTKIMDDKNVRAQHFFCSLNQRKRLVLMNCGRVYYFAETKIDIAYHAHRSHTPNTVHRCLKLAHNKLHANKTYNFSSSHPVFVSRLFNIYEYCFFSFYYHRASLIELSYIQITYLYAFHLIEYLFRDLFWFHRTKHTHVFRISRRTFMGSTHSYLYVNSIMHFSPLSRGPLLNGERSLHQFEDETFFSGNRDTIFSSHFIFSSTDNIDSNSE